MTATMTLDSKVRGSFKRFGLRARQVFSVRTDGERIILEPATRGDGGWKPSMTIGQFLAQRIPGGVPATGPSLRSETFRRRFKP